MQTRSERRRGEEEMRYAVGRSSLGAVLVASSDKGVVAIMIREEREQLLGELQERFPEAHLVAGDLHDRELVRRVIEYIEKPRGELDLEVDVRGTAFQRKVWKAVQGVKFGKTSTYTLIAKKIGASKAMRAVGNACSNNLLSLVIPCHRVLRSDGSASGERHRVLVEREEGKLLQKGAKPAKIAKRGKDERRAKKS